MISRGSWQCRCGTDVQRVTENEWRCVAFDMIGRAILALLSVPSEGDRQDKRHSQYRLQQPDGTGAERGPGEP
jgi:hypothetical protein